MRRWLPRRATPATRHPSLGGRWLLIPAVLFALYGLALFHNALGGTQALFWHDVSIAYLPLRTSAAEAIRHGHLPLWESRMGNGFPVLAEGQAGVFYPLHILNYLGLPQYQTYAILIVLHCALASLFMALFCRIWGMRLMPCLTAGMIYGYSGFFVTHTLHITMIEAAAWLPAALICLEMWLREPRRYGWLALASASLGLQELVAMPQIFFYSVLTAVLYMLVAALSRPAVCRAGACTPPLRESAPAAIPVGANSDSRLPSAVEAVPCADLPAPPSLESAPPPTPVGAILQIATPSLAPRRRFIAAATAAVLFAAVLLAAVQVVPTAFLTRTSAREKVTPQTLRELALTPRNLAYFVHPYIFGSYAEGNYFGRDHYYEVCGFVGTIALLFGIIGAVCGRGRSRTFALILVLLALFMALANQNPLYRIFPHVPGFSFFRGAGRYVLLSSFGLAILAAWGIQALAETRRAVKLCFALGLAGTLLCLAVPVAFRASRSHIVPKLESMVAVSRSEGPHTSALPQEARENQAPGRPDGPDYEPAPSAGEVSGPPARVPPLPQGEGGRGVRRRPDAPNPRAEAEQKFDFLAQRLGPSDPSALMLLLCLALPALACGINLLRPYDARWIGELALALTIVQLFVFGYNYNPTIESRYYESKPKLAAKLNPQSAECLYIHDQEALENALPGDRGWSLGDLSFYWSERELLRANRQVLYDLRSASVFYALVNARYWRLDRALSAALDAKPPGPDSPPVANPRQVLSAMGVKLICTANREALASLPIAQDFGAWLARQNDDPAPLAYFAQGVIPCWTEQAALDKLFSPDFTWRRPVVEMSHRTTFETTPGPTPPQVIAVKSDCGHLTVRCKTSGQELLVVRELYDTHFNCRIDGKRATIWRANYLFRGVVVAPGEHTVEFVYDAFWNLHAGMMVSVGTMLAMLAFLLVRKRQG